MARHAPRPPRSRISHVLGDRVQSSVRTGPSGPARVLITGGAGFIGSHVADVFVATGAQVVVADDLRTGRRDNVPTGAVFLHLDVCSAALDHVIRDYQFDIIVHLAAQIDVRQSVRNPIGDAHTNILGTLRLMEAVRRSGYPTRVVFTSTGGAIYGDLTPPPHTELSPPNPDSPYAISKLSAELYLAYYGRVHGVDAAVLRFGNVYGPRQDPHGEAGVVAIFLERLLHQQPLTIYGDGQQTRDYVYVGDVAWAAYLAATQPLPPIGTLDQRCFNIATGRQTSVLQLAELAQQAVGVQTTLTFAPPRQGEVTHSVLCIDKAMSLLGWRATTSMAEGLRKTVAVADLAVPR